MVAVALVSVVLTAVVVAAIRVQAAPVMTDKLTPHEDDQRQTSLEDPDADPPGRVLKFLAALDEAQKSAHGRISAKGTGLRGNAKFGKNGKMDDLSEDQPLPLLHHDVIAEMSEGLSEINPLNGKYFRKASQQSPKKSKKRACFWKYCIQNK